MILKNQNPGFSRDNLQPKTACSLTGFQSKTPSQIQNPAEFQFFFSKTPPIFKFVLSKTLLTCSVGVLITNTPQDFENFASPNFNFVSKTPTSKAGFETNFFKTT